MVRWWDNELVGWWRRWGSGMVEWWDSGMAGWWDGDVVGRGPICSPQGALTGRVMGQRRGRAKPGGRAACQLSHGALHSFV